MSGPAGRTLVLLAWLAGWANPRLAPATEPLFSQSELIPPAAEEAAARGIDYLVEHQRDEGHFAVSRSGGNVAIVAFAGMALFFAVFLRGSHNIFFLGLVNGAVLAACCCLRDSPRKSYHNLSQP